MLQNTNLCKLLTRSLPLNNLNVKGDASVTVSALQGFQLFTRGLKVTINMRLKRIGLQRL